MPAFVATTLSETGLQDAKVVKGFIKSVYHEYLPRFLDGQIDCVVVVEYPS